MDVLLTGGYGCIGAWVARQLVRRGDAVSIYDRRRDTRRVTQVMDPDEWNQLRFLPGDVTDVDGLRQAIEQHAITHVVHLAALQVPLCRADPVQGARVNVEGTVAVFEAVRSLKDQVQRLVYASSAAVFGPPEAYPNHHTTPLGHDARLLPTTVYGVFKQCNEATARIYYQDHGVSSIGLRPWTVYGVGRDFGMTSEPTKAIKALALGRRYHISYGGWQDLQLAEDVAAAFVRCLDVPFQGAGAYNLRGAVTDLAGFHAALVEVCPEAQSAITYGESQLPIAYNLSDDALQRDLGPLPRTPLVEGIRRTLDRFRQLRDLGRLDTSDLDSPQTAS